MSDLGWSVWPLLKRVCTHRQKLHSPRGQFCWNRESQCTNFGSTLWNGLKSPLPKPTNTDRHGWTSQYHEIGIRVTICDNSGTLWPVETVRGQSTEATYHHLAPASNVPTLVEKGEPKTNMTQYCDVAVATRVSVKNDTKKCSCRQMCYYAKLPRGESKVSPQVKSMEEVSSQLAFLWAGYHRGSQ